jgi:hypothetical protein
MANKVGNKKRVSISKNQLGGFTRQTTPRGWMWVKGSVELLTKQDVLKYLAQTGGHSQPGGKLTDEELAKGII